MMKRKNNFILLTCAVLLIAYSCSSKKTDVSDTPNEGTIYISVEQSFRPVIEQQIKMYENSYPGTHIIATYKPEAECLRDFFNDSITRMAIVSRALTPDEDRAMKRKLGYLPGCQQVASDAVVLILHPNRKDSLFTLDGLRNELSGKANGNVFVFDGQRATGTVRYIRDSILKGAMYNTANVGAKNSASEVINFVANNEDAIGFVGISEIGNPEDSSQFNLRKQIKFGYVRCDVCQDSPYVMPLQQSLNTRRYPLTRGMYYAIKENYTGLGSGFSSFLKYERGQLIFRRSYLSPIMNLNDRNVEINQ